MSDSAFMLAVLEECPGEWVAQADLLQRSLDERGHGFTPHSRAADLRRQGYNIECQVVRDYNRFRGLQTGRARSFYRLVEETEREDEAARLEAWQPDRSASRSAKAGAAVESGRASGGASGQAALFSEPSRPEWA